MTDSSISFPTSTSDAVLERAVSSSLAMGDARLTINERDGVTVLQGAGNWTCSGVHAVDDELRSAISNTRGEIRLDLNHVSNFDSAGAWLVVRSQRAAEAASKHFDVQTGNEAHKQLISVIGARSVTLQKRHMFDAEKRGPLERFGRAVAGMGNDFIAVCNMIGAALRGTAIKTGARGGIRVTSLIHQVDHMGIRAIPVISIMSFLIGAIIAQQSAFQLKQFGEELLTVNLVGILHLREIGVLLTAVMVAGRSGSAITAEIGSMKMREEIDALRVIGLSPIGVLVVPRLLALIIAMPILTLLADFSGLFGAMLVSWVYIDIAPIQFIEALRGAISQSTFLVGVIKAPFMALIIGLIATIEGMKVKGSAESLGQRTTSSVVRSIFAVIFIDGIFAMFYASIGY